MMTRSVLRWFLVLTLVLGLVVVFWGCGSSSGGGGGDDDTGDDDTDDDELPPDCTDEDGDNYSPDGGDCGPIDCDDNDPNTHPGAEELCDGKDNNCDEEIETECWQIVAVDNAAKTGRYPSIWFNPLNDYPAVAYVDVSGKGDKASYQLRFAYYDGEAWHTEVVNPEAYDAKFPTLRISDSGTYYIAYQRGGIVDYIVMASGSPGNWTNEIVKKGLMASKSWPSLVLDAQGNPAVFYFDGAVFGDHGLVCARKMSGSWNYTVVDEDAADSYYEQGARTYAVTAPDGTVGVAYQHMRYEYDSGTDTYTYYYSLKYAQTQDFGSWKVEIVHSWGEDYPNVLTGVWSALAFVPATNSAVISFLYGLPGGLEPGFAVREGDDNWSVYGWDFDFEVGEWPALAAVDNRGLFVYYDSTDVGLMLCDIDMSSYSGECELLDGEDSSVGKWPSIAINSLGDPAIAYYDLTQTQLKVAWYRRFGK